MLSGPAAVERSALRIAHDPQVPVGMTKEHWEAGTDPLPMLEELFPIRGEDSREPPGRKSRLYFVACARRVWGELPWICRRLAEFAEQAADRWNDDRRLRAAVAEVAERLVGTCGSDDPWVLEEVLAEAGRRLAALLKRDDPARLAPPLDSVPKHWDGLAQLVYGPYAGDDSWHRRVPAGLHSAELIRDVFGSPFPPPPALRFDPEWRTDTAVNLAGQMYAGREFDLMPILGDALQDAGCHDRAVLEHCHGSGPHVRGCWVVDLVLGKR